MQIELLFILIVTGGLSDVLKHIHVPQLSDEECKSKWEWEWENGMMCGLQKPHDNQVSTSQMDVCSVRKKMSN